MQRIWLKHYPAGVPAEIDLDACPSLVALLEESFRRHREAAAYRFMGRAFSFGQVDQLSRAFAAYLQASGLQVGDRVAVMMPNVPQYPVAVAGILRAGMVVVNVNPLYTPRELEHQLKDSGAKAIVILENFAATLQQVADAVPTKTVVVAAMGDLLGWFKGALVNHVVRRVRKLVPPWRLPGRACRWAISARLATTAPATRSGPCGNRRASTTLGSRPIRVHRRDSISSITAHPAMCFPICAPVRRRASTARATCRAT